MVPNQARGGLRLTIALANEFAGRGELAGGYTCLLLGLQGARAALRRGEPWAGPLVHLYRRAIDTYIVQHGVRMD